MGLVSTLSTDTIHGPTKIDRKGADGTTVVFYSFPDAQETATIKEGMEFTLRSANETRTEFHPYTVTPANDPVKKDFLESFRQLEGIADVKFYDIKNLTDADKANFKANGITVPATPDINIIRTESKLIDYLGEADPPRKNDNEPSAKTRIEQGLSEDPKRADELQTTALHETLHNLGYRHSQKVESDPKKPALDPLHDTAANTVMSYNAYDNYATPYRPQTYQEIDVKALQETYGVSKHPTPNLEQNLAAEERAQKAAATTTIPAYLKKREFETATLKKLEDFNDQNFITLTNAPNGHVFNDKEIKKLLDDNNKLKKETFSKEELEFLRKRDPNLGTLSVTEIEKRGDNTLVVFNIQNDPTQFGFRGVVGELTPKAMKVIEDHAQEKGNGKYYLEPLNKGNHAPGVGAPEKTPAAPAQPGKKAELEQEGGKTDLARLDIPKISFEGSQTMAEIATSSSVSPKSTITAPSKDVSGPVLA